MGSALLIHLLVPTYSLCCLAEICCTSGVASRYELSEGQWKRIKGSPKPRLGGRSRGGLSTRIHLLADEAGLPVAFRITPGQAAKHARRWTVEDWKSVALTRFDELHDTPERLRGGETCR